MGQRRSTLIIDVKPGEQLRIAEDVTVELVHKSGRVARLRVVAPPDTRIRKGEGGAALGDVVPSMAQFSAG